LGVLVVSFTGFSTLIKRYLGVNRLTLDSVRYAELDKAQIAN